MTRKLNSVTLIILTYNAEAFLDNLFQGISSQTMHFEVIVIDSESSDNTRKYLVEHNVKHIVIPKVEFNHGGTRNIGLTLAQSDIVVFITQDVIFFDSYSIERLVQPLMSNDNNIAMSYGRQLPKADATILSEFARLNNYPDRSTIKSKEDIISLGIKTCFISNSFAAYKKDKLMEFGSFPTHLIMCEDVYVGAKSILLDSKIAYVAEAKVYHSHNYTIGEEFKRYFDIGFFYNSESWILDKFKSAESEGLSYLKREFLFLVNKKKMLLIPEFVFRSAFKYGGFLMGKYQRVIPLRLKRRFSMHAYFWKA